MSRFPCRLRIPQQNEESTSDTRSLICAGLLVCVTEAPLLAQSTADRTEFAVGGGFHVSPDITDLSQLPAVPTVNVRVTRWLNDRWGITGNVIAGVGSGGRKLDQGAHDRLAAQAERAGISEPVYFKDPTYIQFLIRYRMRMRRLSGEEAGQLYFGIGAGAVGVSERTSSPAGLTPRECGAVGKGLGEAPPEPGGVRVMGSDRASRARFWVRLGRACQPHVVSNRATDGRRLSPARGRIH